MENIMDDERLRDIVCAYVREIVKYPAPSKQRTNEVNELMSVINDHTKKAVAEAMKAERQKWLDKAIILADRENVGFPYLYYGCLICRNYNIDARQIKHADDCPAKELL